MPDLVLVDNPDVRGLVKMDVFEDITEELPENIHEEDYYTEVWNSVVYDGKCYGVPFCCNNTAIIYNKDMFLEAGIKPPATWTELKKAALKLTTEEHYGFGISAISGEQGAFQFMPWILGFFLSRSIQQMVLLLGARISELLKTKIQKVRWSLSVFIMKKKIWKKCQTLR